MAGYVSPIPAEERLDYRIRDLEGFATRRRVHLWPRANDLPVICDPNLCRECQRERTWTEGQTHGR